jgi:hypothetical protein
LDFKNVVGNLILLFEQEEKGEKIETIVYEKAVESSKE